MGSEEFFNQMVEVLGITVDRRPKGRPHKIENYIKEKNRMYSHFLIM